MRSNKDHKLINVKRIYSTGSACLLVFIIMKTAVIYIILMELKSKITKNEANLNTVYHGSFGFFHRIPELEVELCRGSLPTGYVTVIILYQIHSPGGVCEGIYCLYNNIILQVTGTANCIQWCRVKYELNTICFHQPNYFTVMAVVETSQLINLYVYSGGGHG